jgi:hypothetical protein
LSHEHAAGQPGIRPTLSGWRIFAVPVQHAQSDADKRLFENLTAQDVSVVTDTFRRMEERSGISSDGADL